MFSNARDVLVHTSFSVNSESIRQKVGIELLQKAVAPGASHNSGGRYDPPKCHPNTRVAILRAIMDWIEDGQKTSFIKWLYGPAGSGKSALAQTIAEICYESGILVASFFWSRNAAGLNDEKRLVATLAYQLMFAIPQMRVHVEEALEHDPSILSRSLESQMKALVLEPLEKNFLHAAVGGTLYPGKSKLIILDGLDECGTPQAQQYVLKVISDTVRKFPIPLIFLITSRPEPAMRDSFSTQPLLSITATLALDDTYHPDADIRLFLVDRFASLKKSHPLNAYLPPAWPTADSVDLLVQKSSGQFIYASTVMKFVSSSRHRPVDRLDIIFGIRPAANALPFAELDTLYHHIFSSVDDLPRALEIMGCLCVMTDVDPTIPAIESILGYRPGEVQLILNDLHSILKVPEADLSRKIRFWHASLPDFLRDPTRSRDLHIDENRARTQIASWVLRHPEGIPLTNNVDDPQMGKNINDTDNAVPSTQEVEPHRQPETDGHPEVSHSPNKPEGSNGKVDRSDDDIFEEGGCMPELPKSYPNPEVRRSDDQSDVPAHTMEETTKEMGESGKPAQRLPQQVQTNRHRSSKSNCCCVM